MRPKSPSDVQTIRTPAVERFSAMTKQELMAYCDRILSGQDESVVRTEEWRADPPPGDGARPVATRR